MTTDVNNTAVVQDSAAEQMQELHNAAPRCGFFQAVKQSLRDTFKYSGRITRSEFWWPVLFHYLELTILLIVSIVVYEDYSSYAIHTFGTYLFYFTYAYAIGMYIPMLSATVRRLHDRGYSGWYCFISLIPIVGCILLYVELGSDGEVGDNKYGHDPKIP